MRLLIGIAVLMVATASTAHAQATPACAKPGQTVKIFDTERREPFSGVLTTIPPNPALFPLLPGLLGLPGAIPLEVRERLVYDRQERAIKLITFVIPSSAPFPTTDAELQDAPTGITTTGITIVERATLGVEQIIFSCQPVPSIMWVGTMQQDFPRRNDAVYPGGWGVDVTGATFAFSTGYTTKSNPNPPGSSYTDFTTNPPTMHVCTDGLFNVTESVAGVGVAWAQCAVGTLSFGKEHGNEHKIDEF